MSRDDVIALRAQACAMIATLGGILDSLQLVDETLATPDDAFSDGVVISQLLDEAAATADTLAECTHSFASAIDQHQIEVRDRVVALEKGTR